MFANTFNNKETKKKLEEIYTFIKNEIEKNNCIFSSEQIGLYSGHIGIALFLYEYSQYDKTTFEENENLINQIVENAFAHVQATPNVSRSLCNGLIGTVLGINFLKEKNVINLEDDYISKEIIEYLENGSIIDTLKLHNPDILHGGLGFLLYLIENRNLPNWESLVENQLNSLLKIENNPTSFTTNWKTNPINPKRNLKNQYENDINLGLAHGVSGIIILLTKLKQLNYSTHQIDKGIERGMNLILSTKLKDNALSFLYPITIVDGKAELNSRLAWCYGDFCVALASWHSWKATGQEKYKFVSLEIMDNALSITPKNARTNDISICHGTAGVSYIFRNFYWETNNKMYENAANFWINETLKMSKKLDKFILDNSAKPISDDEQNPQLGILEGWAGVGLTLISALTNKRGDWDKFFLIN